MLKKDCFAQPKTKLSNTTQSTTQINEECDAEIPLDTMEFVLFSKGLMCNISY